ncbi:MAG TPA: tetratricopeptide repeat protein [candidate division Zixibacteria bacterium]
MKRKRTDSFLIAPDQSAVWFTRVTVFLCGAVLLFRLVSSFFPKERLWGINHLAYFSPYFAISITILGLLVLVPRINRLLQDNLRRPLNFVHELTIGKHKYLYFIIFSFLSIIVFWFLRVKTYFLGDEYHLITALPAGELVFKWSEPLEIAAHLYLYELLRQFMAVDGAIVYSLISYIAGVVFVFLVFLTADLLGKSKSEKVFVFSILVSMGSILLFFGYAENYSLTYTAILAYLYFALRYLKNESSILPTTLMFVLGCSLHLLTFSLLPSLLFLYLLKSDTKTREFVISKKRVLLYSLLSLFIITGIYVYIVKYGKLSSLLTVTVPLTAAWYSVPGYTLFSFSHLLDMFNEQILVSPIGLVLLLVILIVFGLKRTLLSDRTSQFLVIVTIFQMTFHFLIDPDLGATRDWDLFSFTALGYTLLGIYLFSKLVQDKQKLRYIGAVLISTVLFSTLPWVMLNASTEKSLKRIIDAVDLDPKRNPQTYINLGTYLVERGLLEDAKKMGEKLKVQFPWVWLTLKGQVMTAMGDLQGAEAAFKEAIQSAPMMSSAHLNLGITYFERGKMDMAILEFERAIQLNPEGIIAFKSYAWIGDVYAQRGQFDKAIQAYNKAINGEIVNKGEVYQKLGRIYVQRREFDKAIEMYKESIEREINNKELVYQSLGHCYFIKNELDKAISMYQKALKLDPDVIEPHAYLGHAYLKKGMKDKAIEEYKIYLKYGKDDEQIKTIKALILKLNQEKSNS